MNKIRRLEKECDVLWQKVIVSLYRQCVGCRATSGLCGHHIIKRKHHRTRHIIINGLCVCPTCHDYFERNPGTDLAYCKKNNYPQYEWLMMNKHPEILRYSEDYLKSIKKTLQEALDGVFDISDDSILAGDGDVRA